MLQSLLPFPSSLTSVYGGFNVLTLCIGGLLNSTTVWLILHHTPKEMRVYSRILLQTCFIDLLTLVIFALIEPVCLCPNKFIVLKCGLILKFYRFNCICCIRFAYSSDLRITLLKSDFAKRG